MYGRLPATAGCVVLTAASGTLGALMPDWGGFAATRFLTGVGGLGTYMCSFVLAVEVVRARYKASVGVLSGIPFALGELLVALEAYFIREKVLEAFGGKN